MHVVILEGLAGSGVSDAALQMIDALATASGSSTSPEHGPIPANAIAQLTHGMHFLTDAFASGHMRVPRHQVGADCGRENGPEVATVLEQAAVPDDRTDRERGQRQLRRNRPLVAAHETSSGRGHGRQPDSGAAALRRPAKARFHAAANG